MKNMRIEHPECQPGEWWLMNANEKDFNDIRWKTKRRGVQCFDMFGKSYSHDGIRPVFAQQAELLAAGVDLAKS